MADNITPSALHGWEIRNLGEPISEGGRYWISVKTEYKFATDYDIDRVLQEATEIGVKYILDYFNRKSDDVNFDELDVENRWNLDDRPNSRIVVLVGLNQSEIENHQEKDAVTFAEASKEFGKTATIAINKIRDIIAKIIKKIEQVRKQMERWKGRVLNFSIATNIKLLNQLPDEIEKLLAKNGIYPAQAGVSQSARDDEAFIMGVDSEYRVKNVFYRSPNDPDNRAVAVGFNAFIGLPPFKEPRVVSLFINALNDLDKFLDNSTTWIEVITKFMWPAVVLLPLAKVADDVKENFEKGYEKTLPKKYRKGLKKGYNAVKKSGVVDVQTKMKLRKRREGETDFIGDGPLVNLEVKPLSIKRLEDVFIMVLNDIDIDVLIDISFDCMLKWPNIKFPKFKIPRFKIPTFKFPKLPVLDLMIFIRINFEEIIIQLILALLLNLIKMVIGLIIRFCEEKETDKSYGKRRPKFSPPVLEDTTKIINPDITIPGFDLSDFIDEVFGSLTPSEICALLRGEPSEKVLSIIRDILDEPRFAAIKAIFVTDSSIIVFFEELGKILGQKELLNLCEFDPGVSVDPCDIEQEYEDLQRRLFAAKKERGEGLTDDLVEEQIKNSKRIRQELADEMLKMVEGDGFVSKMQEEINKKIGSFNLGEALPDDIDLLAIAGMPANAIIDQIFDFKNNKKRGIADATSYLLDIPAEYVSLDIPPTTSTTKQEEFRLRFKNTASGIYNSQIWSSIDFYHQILNTLVTNNYFQELSISDNVQRSKQAALDIKLGEVEDPRKRRPSKQEVEIFKNLLEYFIKVILFEEYLKIAPVIFTYDLRLLWEPEANGWRQTIEQRLREKLMVYDTTFSAIGQGGVSEFIRSTVPVIDNLFFEAFAEVSSNLGFGPLIRVDLEDEYSQRTLSYLGADALLARTSYEEIFVLPSVEEDSKEDLERKKRMTFDGEDNSLIGLIKISLDGISKSMLNKPGGRG